jgi:hypothetical protein
MTRPVVRDDDPTLSTVDSPASACGSGFSARSQVRIEHGALLANRYRIVERIGRGAAGSVYHALDEARGGSAVALKLLGEPQPLSLYRIKNEFRALSETRHPNLVRLHGLGMDERGWFVVMDRVADGCDFLSYVRDRGRALNVAKLRATLIQLLRGIAAIHEAGKLHRDLKPSNVLVTSEGQLVIVDYGLVRDQTNDDGSLATEGAFAGTPAYAAPEQMAGDAAGPAADMFALGVMLFEALTGILPFEASSVEALRALKLRASHAPLWTQIEDVPEELGALCVSLLRSDPAERPSARAVLHTFGDREPQAERKPSGASLFVGRETELAALEAAAESARGADPVLVTVTGPSGIGKSALIAQLIERTRGQPGALVLRGRCHAQEQVPYKAFDTLIDELGSYLARIPGHEAERLMPRGAKLLCRLFPTLARAPSLRELPPDASPERDDSLLRAQAFSALKELLARMAERGLLVLTFDDMQWCDEDSAQLLRELLRGPAAPSCLFVCAFRTADDDRDAAARVLGALASGQCRALSLRALPLCHATELTQAVLGDAPPGAEIALIVGEAQGSPLLIRELARAAQWSGSVRGLGDAVARQMAVLERETRDLLELTCVAAQPLSSNIALRAAGVSPDALHPALNSALVRTSTQHGAEMLESSHDRLREAVLASLTPATVTAHHERLARELACEPDADGERVARHYRAAGLAHEAAPYAIAAADRARRSLAFDRAAELYQLALSEAAEPDSAILEARLAEAHANAGRLGKAAELYERAAQRERAVAQRALLGKAMVLYLLAGDSARGAALVDALCRQLGLLRPPHSPFAMRLLLVVLAIRYLLGGRISNATVPARSRHVGLSKERLALCLQASRGFALTAPEHSIYFGLRALLATRRYGDPFGWSHALASEVAFRCAIRGVSSARDERHMARAIALAEAQQDEEALSVVLSMDGARRLYGADLVGALHAFERAEQVLTARGRSVAQVFNGTRAGRFAAWGWMGKQNEVERHYHAWTAEARALGDRAGERVLTEISAYRHLALDAPAAARATRESMSEGKPSPSDAEPWWWADIALYEDDPHLALEAYGRARRSPFFRTAHLGSWHKTWSALTVARVSLFAAAEQPHRGHLQRAQSTLKILERQRYPLAEPAAAQVRAGMAMARGNVEHTLSELTHAASGYARMHCLLWAAAMRYRRGQLLGGDAGARETREALAAGEALGVTRPRQWFRMYAPGFSD